MLTVIFFFFNDTATTEIYTLSLHDALPICCSGSHSWPVYRLRSTPLGCRSTHGYSSVAGLYRGVRTWVRRTRSATRSEEHTSELQSRQYLVCRLLLEKKKVGSTRSTNSSHC